MADKTPTPAQILRLYKKLGTATAVARELQMPYHAVRMVLLKQGVKLTKKRPPIPNHSPAAIRQYYYRLGSARAVAQELQVQYYAVLQTLHDQGIRTRRGMPKGTKIRRANSPFSDPSTDSKIIALYEKGQTCRAIAFEIGCSRQAILDRLRKLNIPIRPRGCRFGSRR